MFSRVYPAAALRIKGGPIKEERPGIKHVGWDGWPSLSQSRKGPPWICLQGANNGVHVRETTRKEQRPQDWAEPKKAWEELIARETGAAFSCVQPRTSLGQLNGDFEETAGKRKGL